MKTKDALRPVLFVLEDDETCASEWKQLADEKGWRTIVAGSVEGALDLGKAKARTVDLALIDLMVPLYEEDLVRVRELQAERRELTRPIIKVHEKTKQNVGTVRHLDAELIRIDSSLRELIVEDGGLLFLEEVAGRGWLDSWKYVVFSATDQARREPELEKRGVRKHGRYLGWYGKPIDPEAIAKLLDSQLK